MCIWGIQKKETKQTCIKPWCNWVCIQTNNWAFEVKCTTCWALIDTLTKCIKNK